MRESSRDCRSVERPGRCSPPGRQTGHVMVRHGNDCPRRGHLGPSRISRRHSRKSPRARLPFSPLATTRRASLADDGCWRWLVAIGTAVGLAVSTAITGRAEPPGDSPASPFPEMAHITAFYNELPAEQFFLPDHPGVWFLSPSGLNCGIWIWGSFGCAGDIPGAPAGDNHIAWFNGNRGVHHGWTAAVQYPAGQAQQTLPPRSYVTFESTTCAVTPDSNVYCAHGEFKFLTTPQGTWFKAIDDRRSYVCNAYASCPAG